MLAALVGRRRGGHKKGGPPRWAAGRVKGETTNRSLESTTFPKVGYCGGLLPGIRAEGTAVDFRRRSHQPVVALAPRDRLDTRAELLAEVTVNCGRRGAVPVPSEPAVKFSIVELVDPRAAVDVTDPLVRPGRREGRYLAASSDLLVNRAIRLDFRLEFFLVSVVLVWAIRCCWPGAAGAAGSAGGAEVGRGALPGNVSRAARFPSSSCASHTCCLPNSLFALSSILRT